MMNERFTDCKMLIAFCYILSLALKGTATGTLEIQPTHDLCREKCYCQKDVQSCRCGEVLMPTKSQRSPKSSCSVVQSILTPKVSQNCFREHWGSCRAKWWWQPLKHRGCRAQKHLLTSPSWLCVHQAFTPWSLCPVLWHTAESESTFPERACLHWKGTMTEIIASPAPGCSC